MKEDKKIPLSELCKALQSRMKYKDPLTAILALLIGWVRHPRYTSPTWKTIYFRRDADGYIWLKASEIPSFEEYVGYPLR